MQLNDGEGKAQDRESGSTHPGPTSANLNTSLSLSEPVFSSVNNENHFTYDFMQPSRVYKGLYPIISYSLFIKS